jgi:signal transduction histidine kinase
VASAVPQARRRSRSLRTQLLLAVLLPGVLMFVVAAAVGIGPIIDAARQNALVATVAEQADSVAIPLFHAVDDERAASLRFAAAPTDEHRQALGRARGALNSVAATVSGNVEDIVGTFPVAQQQPLRDYAAAMARLPQIRSAVDGGALDLVGVLDAYGPIGSILTQSSYSWAVLAPTGAVGNRLTRTADLLHAQDLLNAADALAVARLEVGPLSPAEYGRFAQGVGAARAVLAKAEPWLDSPEREAFAALRAGAPWVTTQAGQDALLAAPPLASRAGATTVPVDVAAFGTASQKATSDLMELGFTAGAAAFHADSDVSRADLVRTVALVAGLLLAILAATGIAWVVASRLVGRLGRLRRETLTLADQRLPEAVRRLRDGEPVDLESDVPALDFGGDEIGEVAAAFNHAQRTAVRAAVDEANTRSGFNAAFLNIARRSQVILHQQMQLLDQVERSESDPDQLEMLFRLDHLTTRERRNAENLVILGGGQPRRRWRKPVPITELVRGAVGEAEHYQRVSVGRLPDVHVVGPAVGDLVHLLAELIDNATSFSPPQAPIEIRGAVVGRGVAVEVEDQGLGIEDHRLAELNETLGDPPDFSLFTLSEDARIGLFVVAWLARKHDVTVSLRRSTYGGITAGVLIPNSALTIGDRMSEPSGYGAEVAVPAPRRYAPTPQSMPQPTAQSAPRNGHALPPPPAEQAAEPVSASGVLPPLPQRSRQSHMSPQLQTMPGAPQERESAAPAPTVARDRMAALQRGAAAARRDPLPDQHHPKEAR